MPGLSQKVLIQQLREMEEHGLVHLKTFSQILPRVDYSAPSLGFSLEPIIISLYEWGRRHAEALDEMDRTAECVIGRPAVRRTSIVANANHRSSS